jgi:hypothetical protein
MAPPFDLTGWLLFVWFACVFYWGIQVIKQGTRPEETPSVIQPRTIAERLFPFIEQPLFTLPVGIAGGIVGVLFAIPVLLVIDGCLLLALHRSRALDGLKRGVKVFCYATLFVVVGAACMWIGILVKDKARASAKELVDNIVVAIRENRQPPSGTTPTAGPSPAPSPTPAEPAIPSSGNQISGSTTAPHLLALFPAGESGSAWPVRIINDDDTFPLIDVHVGISRIPPPGSPLSETGEAIRNEKWYSLGNILPGVWDVPITIAPGSRYYIDLVTRQARFYQRLEITPDSSVPTGWKESSCLYRYMADKPMNGKPCEF